MSIAKMEHLTVVGLRDEMDDVIQVLMELGAVQLIDQSAGDQAQDEPLTPSEQGPATQQSDLFRIEAAIALSRQIRGLPVKKKSDRRSMQAAQLLKIARKENDLLESINQLEANQAKISELNVHNHRNQTTIALLEPWQALDLDLANRQTRLVRIFVGSLESEQQRELMAAQLKEYVPDSYLEIITADEAGLRCAVAVSLAQAEEAQNILRQNGFNRLPDIKTPGTPAQQVARLKKETESITEQLQSLDADNQRLAENIEDFELLHDLLLIRQAKTKSAAAVALGRNTFWLEGWVPARLVSRVKKVLGARFLIALETRQPREDESYPVLLENSRFVSAFESIVTMFSVPTVGEGDPTPILSIFYLFIFGLMLADVGYGFLLSAFTAVLIWKFKMKNEMVRMLFYCGLSSIVWGFLFGSIFGDMIPVLSQQRIIPRAWWFNPIEDATKLLIWSMIFGVIHLFAGMAVKIKILFQTGQAKDAVLDIFPWYFILTGGGLLLAGWGGQAGLILVIIGAAVLVLFGGRSAKNPILRILKGLLSLYDITGYFSDILSYTRILALILATGVIAMVVNLLGFMLGPSVIGFIMFIIVAIFGHLLNLALSSLSAYVHTCRLHYVEFFGKFYEGGGHLWEPLCLNTRYVKVESEK